ncbi:MAG: hypothetical protein KAS32_12165 [Candidatus Peribacteraceae bacterium]|nr:hypothetical protein [Candidatus Peribacteraceae bacterium]
MGLFDDIIDGVSNTVEKAIDNPVGFAVDSATAPLRNGIDVIDGLTEGELRTKAALSLGTDVVSGMALSEVIEWYND